MKKFSICIVLLFGLIVFGCAQKKLVKPSEEQPTVITHKTEKHEADTVDVRPEEKITEHQFAKIESKEEPILYTEERDVFEDIYFDYDEYGIRDDAKAVLENIASWLLKNKSVKILIEGHCDSRGTSEYNLALGDRRAKSTKDYLGALGIASNRVEMLSYGEEKPLCLDDSEECLQLNRRAHFVVLKEAY
jgi:peptidoglycan-associated lipoprotein